MAKKSETIEIRLSHEAKEALKHAATSRSETVSELVRSLVDAYLDSPEHAFSVPRWWAITKRHGMLWLGAATCLVLALAAVLAILESDYLSSNARAFRSLDLNADGRIAGPELEMHYGGGWTSIVPMAQIDIDADQTLSRAEYDAWQVTIHMAAYQQLIASRQNDD